MVDPDSPPSKKTRFDLQRNNEQEQEETAADTAGNDTQTTTPVTTKIYDLNTDILGLCHSLLGVGHYRYVAMACKILQKGNLAVNDNKKITSMEVVTSSISCARQFFEDEGTDTKELRLFWHSAARYNRIEVMIWAHEEGFSSAWQGNGPSYRSYFEHNPCSVAAKYGHISCLKWLRENGCDWDADTCSFAAGGGHLSCLIWLRENGCPWEMRTSFSAASNGHLSCLKWARENGCDWNWATCFHAASKGHLSCLIWARENGCDWDAGICQIAAANGHLSCLKWARENGCNWNKFTYMGAQRSHNTDVLNYVIHQGCPRH